MIVYGNSLSPFVRKVLVFAAEKGVAVDTVPTGLGRGGPEFEEASPFRKMPALRDPGADGGRDFTISDSTAICTYLEAKHPEPPLLPAGACDRARVVWFEEFADTVLQPVGARMFFNRFVAPQVLGRAGDEAVAVRAETEELPPLLKYLEGVVPDEGFLVGDSVTLADIAIASPFATLRHIGWMIDPDHWPKTLAYVAGIMARPSFATLLAAERAVVAGLAARAAAAGSEPAGA